MHFFKFWGEIQYVFVWFTQEIIKTTYELNKNNTNIP